MSPSSLRRKMEEAGYPASAIDEQVDALARDLAEGRKRDEQLEKLQAMGYTERDLERSNPYNQWMYE